MDFKLDSQFLENQLVINDTTCGSSTSGALVIKGGVSSKDTYITGHAAVNNVKITPNLNDIIFEQQATLNSPQVDYIDIDNFYFSNSITSSFKAFVNINVVASIPKYALYELNGWGSECKRIHSRSSSGYI